MTNKKINGPKLAKQIASLGLTRSEFARIAKISVPSLYKILTNQVVRDSTRAKAINALLASTQFNKLPS